MKIANLFKKVKKEKPVFDKRRQQMIEYVAKKCKEATKEGRFSLFMVNDLQAALNNPTVKTENIEFVLDICEKWDPYCNIPLEFGLFLERESRNPNYVMGVHRTNASMDDLQNIMTEGLVNYGHLFSSGAILLHAPDLDLTYTPLNGLTGFLNIVGSYKGNDKVVISAFPTDVVDRFLFMKDKSKANRIYTKEGEYGYRVKPEYMIAAIIKNKNGLDEVKLRSEFLEQNMTK